MTLAKDYEEDFIQVETIAMQVSIGKRDQAQLQTQKQVEIYSQGPG